MHDDVLTRARSHRVQIRTDTMNSERKHVFMNMRTAFTANPGKHPNEEDSPVHGLWPGCESIGRRGAPADILCRGQPTSSAEFSAGVIGGRAPDRARARRFVIVKDEIILVLG